MVILQGFYPLEDIFEGKLHKERILLSHRQKERNRSLRLLLVPHLQFGKGNLTWNSQHSPVVPQAKQPFLLYPLRHIHSAKSTFPLEVYVFLFPLNFCFFLYGLWWSNIYQGMWKNQDFCSLQPALAIPPPLCLFPSPTRFWDEN